MAKVPSADTVKNVLTTQKLVSPKKEIVLNPVQLSAKNGKQKATNHEIK